RRSSCSTGRRHPMADITDEKLALIEHDEGEASDDDIAAIIARLRKAEAERYAERVKAYRAGLLDAAAHCDDYAAVVADDPDDLDAEGPHETHVSVARHLARELRKIADRD